jgi:thiol-disulfide isomerase/thioredoxin
MGEALLALVRRLGGLFADPRTTMLRLAAGKGGAPLEAIALYLWVQLCVLGRMLYRNLSLAGEAPRIALKRSYESLWALGRNDLLLFVVVLVALLLLGRLLRRERLPARGLAAAAAYLLVPLALLKGVGALTLWLGVDQWWLPHHAVDSSVVVVAGRVDWTRFAFKAAVAYGPSAILLAELVVGLVKGRARAATASPSFAPSAVGVLVVGLLAALAFGSAADVASQAARLRPALPGDRLPDILLPWLELPPGESSSFRPADYEGRVLVMDFWASWCTPCLRSMPELSALYEELRGEGLAVVGVNREPYARAEALASLQDMKLAFPSALDQRGYGERLGLNSLPTSYIVDRQGVLRHLHLGYTDIATVRAEVKALLRER